jgi:hypothetical protein
MYTNFAGGSFGSFNTVYVPRFGGSVTPTHAVNQSLHTNPFLGYSSNVGSQYRHTTPAVRSLRQGMQSQKACIPSSRLTFSRPSYDQFHSSEKTSSPSDYSASLQANGTPSYPQRMQTLQQGFKHFLNQHYPTLSVPEAMTSFHQNIYQPLQQRLGRYVNQFSNGMQQWSNGWNGGFSNLTQTVYNALGVPQSNTLPGYAAPYQLGSGAGLYDAYGNVYGLQGGLGYPMGYNPVQNAILPPIVSGQIYPASYSLNAVPQIPNIGQLM